MCGAHNSKFIIQNSKFLRVVPGRLELPTSTLSVWRSNQLSYRTVGDSVQVRDMMLGLT
jgi:hypothetical protein